MNKLTQNPQETLEFKPTQSKDSFSLNTPISIEGCWMLGLMVLQVYSSVFYIKKENNIFELFTDVVEQFSFTELKDELEEILDI